MGHRQTSFQKNTGRNEVLHVKEARNQGDNDEDLAVYDEYAESQNPIDIEMQNHIRQYARHAINPENAKGLIHTKGQKGKRNLLSPGNKIVVDDYELPSTDHFGHDYKLPSVDDKEPDFRKSRKEANSRTRSESLIKALESERPTIRSLCGSFFFHPQSKYMRRWDVTTAFLMLYVALVTPYEVAFLSESMTPDALTIINLCVDLLFLIDIFMQFLVAYYDPVSGHLECDRKAIATYYIRTWFSIDLFSIFPFQTIAHGVLDAGTCDDCNKLRLVRVLRLVRLTKLARILKAGKLFERWEQTFQMTYASLDLLKLGTETLFVVHWIACAWKLVLDLEAGASDPCLFTPEEALKYGDLPWVADSGYCSLMNFDLYVVTFYWAVTTISTIGYGDAANPNTTAERMMGVLCMIVGSGFYAYVLGAVCSIVSAMGHETMMYREQLDQVRIFCKDAQIPPELRDRVVNYLRKRKSIRTEENFTSIHTILSPTLRGEVAYFLNREWIGEVGWIGAGPVAFVTDLAMLLVTHLHAPMELINGRFLHIVVKGIAVKDNRVLASGCTWGKDMILHSQGLKRPKAARAISFLQTKSLTKETFKLLLAKYPKERKRVRMEALWLGLKRGLIMHREHIAHLFYEILHRIDAPGKETFIQNLKLHDKNKLGWVPNKDFSQKLKRFYPRLTTEVARSACLHYSMHWSQLNLGADSFKAPPSSGLCTAEGFNYIEFLGDLEIVTLQGTFVHYAKKRVIARVRQGNIQVQARTEGRESAFIGGTTRCSSQELVGLRRQDSSFLVVNSPEMLETEAKERPPKSTTQEEIGLVTTLTPAAAANKESSALGSSSKDDAELHKRVARLESNLVTLLEKMDLLLERSASPVKIANPEGSAIRPPPTE
jgi:potassium voltage-gated channel Eag-related subfamily H protein 7